MKKQFLIFTSVLFCAITFAQSVPQGINYQAVARDASGDVLMNQTLTIQLSVISDTTTSAISWQETHTVATNDFGLFTLVIGQGTTTTVGNSLTFDSISWGASNHYIQVEMNGVDMGITQFMSVPYALQAGNLGADSTMVANIIAASALSQTSVVGQYKYGGVVFWVDGTGQHGLVCSIEDQSSGIQWYNGANLDVKAMREGAFGGASNTERITGAQGSGAYAAFICAQYTGGGYGDWYLPAKEELNQMRLNKTIINTTAIANGGSSFTPAGYWSSTENDVDNVNAWVQFFYTGLQWISSKSVSNDVRAVRAF
ncbi:MAG TPA: DUF1566 domain-containing protein [Flavobacteriales bacterium]|nr:DUF1566 domain-containing protein [Flavobacteriales bacterium]